jgi:hypothetical protein
MLDAATLSAALPRWCAGVHAAAPELNELDGRLGDADLGATLDKCATLIEEALPEMPDTLEGIFKRCAQASARASGSSFGTLLTVALMTSAKRCAGVTWLDRSQVAALLADVVTTLSARGGANLGDKTVLDGLHPDGARRIARRRRSPPPGHRRGARRARRLPRQAQPHRPRPHVRRQDDRHGRPRHGGAAAHG